MATRVSKPEFNIRQKLSELDRPVGTNGSQLLKSADAAESFVLTQAGRRNLVINGNPIIYQRGRTATDHGVYVYALQIDGELVLMVIILRQVNGIKRLF